MIQFLGNETWFERVAVAKVTGSECFIVQPNGSMALVNLAAVTAVKLVPAGGGRPTGVRRTVESFLPAPTAAKRRE